jgi:hypothetical protein
MSTGAKIGLGVGIPIGIIALAAAAFILYRRGVRKGAAAKETPVVPEKDGSGVPSSGHSDAGNGYYAPTKPVVVGELNGGQQGWVHELPADGNGGNGRSQLP